MANEAVAASCGSQTSSASVAADRAGTAARGRPAARAPSATEPSAPPAAPTATAGPPPRTARAPGPRRPRRPRAERASRRNARTTAPMSRAAVGAADGDEVGEPGQPEVLGQDRVEIRGVPVDEPGQQPALLARQAGHRAAQGRPHAAGGPLPPRRTPEQVGRPVGEQRDGQRGRVQRRLRACRRRRPAAPAAHPARSAHRPGSRRRRPSGVAVPPRDSIDATPPDLDPGRAPPVPCAASVTGSLSTVTVRVTAACRQACCTRGEARACPMRAARGSSTRAAHAAASATPGASRATARERLPADAASTPTATSAHPIPRASDTACGRARQATVASHAAPVPTARRRSNGSRSPAPSALRRGTSVPITAAPRPPRSHRDQRTQRRVLDVADTADVVELVGAGEVAVRATPVKDVLRQHRPHPGQRLQLIGRGGVEIDRPGRGAPALPARGRVATPAGAATAPPFPAGSPTTICCPSLTRAARFRLVRSTPGRAPPAAAIASSIRAPATRWYSPGRCTLPATSTTTSPVAGPAAEPVAGATGRDAGVGAVPDPGAGVAAAPPVPTSDDPGTEGTRADTATARGRAAISQTAATTAATSTAPTTPSAARRPGSTRTGTRAAQRCHRVGPCRGGSGVRSGSGSSASSHPVPRRARTRSATRSDSFRTAPTLGSRAGRPRRRRRTVDTAAGCAQKGCRRQRSVLGARPISRR